MEGPATYGKFAKDISRKSRKENKYEIVLGITFLEKNQEAWHFQKHQKAIFSFFSNLRSSFLKLETHYLKNSKPERKTKTKNKNSKQKVICGKDKRWLCPLNFQLDFPCITQKNKKIIIK